MKSFLFLLFLCSRAQVLKEATCSPNSILSDVIDGYVNSGAMDEVYSEKLSSGDIRSSLAKELLHSPTRYAQLFECDVTLEQKLMDLMDRALNRKDGQDKFQQVLKEDSWIVQELFNSTAVAMLEQRMDARVFRRRIGISMPLSEFVRRQVRTSQLDTDGMQRSDLDVRYFSLMLFMLPVSFALDLVFWGVLLGRTAQFALFVLDQV